jgi:hypothetical protein
MFAFAAVVIVILGTGAAGCRSGLLGADASRLDGNGQDAPSESSVDAAAGTRGEGVSDGPDEPPGFDGSNGTGGTAGVSGTAGGAAGSGGAGGGFQPGCHIDCFGRTTCRDGVVTVWAHNPVPCDQWTGECPHGVVTTCSKGCNAAAMNGPTNCPQAICRENAPKAAGDACQADDDCRPTPATASGNVYLRCDTGTGKCVTAGPPVLGDWLEACTPSAVESLRGITTPFRVFADTKCSAGACAAAGRETCIAQGCTQPCRSDDECPAGSVCSEAACNPFDSMKRGFCVGQPASFMCLP